MTDRRIQAAAQLSMMVTRASAHQIRRSGVRPFGLVPGSRHPEPICIGQRNGSGTISGALAGVVGRPVYWTMALEYGLITDGSTPYIEVISDFHRDDPGDERTIEDALEWVIERATEADPRASDDLNREIILDPAALGTAGITVRGARRAVPAGTYGEYKALQFDDDGVLVSVVTRHLQWSDLPEVVRIDDLEPYLRPLDDLDPQAIAAYFQSQRAKMGTGHDQA
jgi:hypothetical protein